MIPLPTDELLASRSGLAALPDMPRPE
jgi:hypothetical protein